ncbi:MAG TPA: Trm112 family protein [Longimicrobium sp.]|jgi:uncharacterized protein YbaR (Trm112 family)
MYILLTDILTCPRCGPEFGLVLLADRVEERRVLEGRLGCANCRETYPIHDGAADLRTSAPGAAPVEEEGSVGDAQEGAVRIAALLGLAEAAGTVLVAGPGAVLAPQVSALVPGIEVVALAPAPLPGPEAPGVSRVAAGPALPFRGRSLRGAAFTGGADAALLAEGLRVLAPGSRIVVERAGAEVAGQLRRAGAAVLLEDDGVVVARAPGEPVPLRMNALR